MSWPFSFAAPSMDTTVMEVPTSATLVSTAAGTSCWLAAWDFYNPHASATYTVQFLTGAGTVWWSKELGPGAVIEGPTERPCKPLVGLKWKSSGSGVIGHAWGYQ